MNIVKSIIDFFTPEKPVECKLVSKKGRMLLVTYTYLDPENHIRVHNSEKYPNIELIHEVIPYQYLRATTFEPREDFYLQPKTTTVILEPGHSVPINRILDIQTKWCEPIRVTRTVNVKRSRLELENGVGSR